MCLVRRSCTACVHSGSQPYHVRCRLGVCFRPSRTKEQSSQNSSDRVRDINSVPASMRSRPCRHFHYSGMIGILSPHRREGSCPLLAATHATTMSIDINNGQRLWGNWVRTTFERTMQHKLFLLLAMHTKVGMSGIPHKISDLTLEYAFTIKLFQSTILLLLLLRTVRNGVLPGGRHRIH